MSAKTRREDHGGVGLDDEPEGVFAEIASGDLLVWDGGGPGASMAGLMRGTELVYSA
jgi:hypothetical protein